MELPEFRDAAIDTQLVDRRGGDLVAEPRHRELAAQIAAYLLAAGPRSAGAVAVTTSAVASPWETLGAWRLGIGGRSS
jgi:hypothetical protein